MADWAEVRRLAADFQRLQASSTAHRLSERNCVELVSKLVERGLLEIVYTLDGKEYVTPGQLDREIRNELAVHGGRINIVDLQQILNVDLSHIECRVTELMKHDRSLTLLNGELIDREYEHYSDLHPLYAPLNSRSYMKRLCEEINDIIQEAGQASIADLSRNFGLPITFLTEHIEGALGVQIWGHLDKSDTGVIYTESYVNRHRSRIRGLFRAITQPTSISSVLSEGAFQEKLFNTVLHQLISSEELAGDLRGRQEKAVYIPHIFTRNQNKWTDSFLATNGYLEYDALSRLGIEDPRGYIMQRYSASGSSSDELIQLSTCCVGKAVISRVEGALEEVLGSGHWLDAMPLLPSPCTESDAELLLRHLSSSQPDLQLFGSVAATKSFLRICCDHFKPAILEKAQAVARGNVAVLKTNEEKRGSNKRKGGGSRKGGKGRGHGDDEGEDTFKSSWEHKFMTTNEIFEELTQRFPDCPENFLLDIAAKIETSLQNSFVEEVKDCVSTTSQSTSASQLRKKHAQLQEKVQGLWNMLHLFEKAIRHFEDDTAIQLNRYLLRSLCSDVFNLVISYIADDNGVTLPPETEFTSKERTKVIATLPTPIKKKLTDINTILNGKEVVAFLEHFEGLCTEEYCGIMLKKPDKKKERQLLFSHYQSLLESVRCEWEPSMVLHLVVVLLFQQTTNCAIHIPGKLVPQVVAFLQNRVDNELYVKISVLEQMVIEQRKHSPQPIKGKASTAECERGRASEEKIVPEQIAHETESKAVGASDSGKLNQEMENLLDDLKQMVIRPKKA